VHFPAQFQKNENFQNSRQKNSKNTPAMIGQRLFQECSLFTAANFSARNTGFRENIVPRRTFSRYVEASGCRSRLTDFKSIPASCGKSFFSHLTSFHRRNYTRIRRVIGNFVGVVACGEKNQRKPTHPAIKQQTAVHW
jgi:hypothetical protein